MQFLYPATCRRPSDARELPRGLSCVRALFFFYFFSPEREMYIYIYSLLRPLKLLLIYSFGFCERFARASLAGVAEIATFFLSPPTWTLISSIIRTFSLYILIPSKLCDYYHKIVWDTYGSLKFILISTMCRRFGIYPSSLRSYRGPLRRIQSSATAQRRRQSKRSGG